MAEAPAPATECSVITRTADQFADGATCQEFWCRERPCYTYWPFYANAAITPIWFFMFVYLFLRTMSMGGQKKATLRFEATRSITGVCFGSFLASAHYTGWLYHVIFIKWYLVVDSLTAAISNLFLLVALVKLILYWDELVQSKGMSLQMNLTSSGQKTFFKRFIGMYSIFTSLGCIGIFVSALVLGRKSPVVMISLLSVVLPMVSANVYATCKAITTSRKFAKLLSSLIDSNASQDHSSIITLLGKIGRLVTSIGIYYAIQWTVLVLALGDVGRVVKDIAKIGLVLGIASIYNVSDTTKDGQNKDAAEVGNETAVSAAGGSVSGGSGTNSSD